MRSTFWAMVTVLALSVVLCLFARHAQLNLVEDLTKMNDQAREMIWNEDFAGALALSEKMMRRFDHRRDVLEMVSSHDDLHDTHQHLVDAWVALKCEDKDDACQALAQLSEMLEHLRNHEQITLANLC